MRKSKLMSAVKYVSMSVLGAALSLTMIIASKTISKADGVTTGVSFDPNDNSMTITGNIVNDDEHKNGIVLGSEYNKENVEHLLINGATFPSDATSLFAGFNNVKTIYISSPITSGTTNMSWMFNNLKKLEDITIESMNTSTVTNMAGMFSNCSALTELDITSLSVNHITDTANSDDNMADMFKECTNLERIVVASNWQIDSSVHGSNMFYGDFKLVGGNGTKYVHPSSDSPMAVYAKIDSDKTHGYLTNYGVPKIKAGFDTEGSKFVLSVSIDQGEDIVEHTYKVSYGDIENYAVITLGGNHVAPRSGSFELTAVAKEINDEKPLVIKKDDVEVFNNSISVAYYLRRLIDIYDSSSESDTKIRNMAGSILRYGAAAQKYFKHNTDKLANKGIVDFTNFTDNINQFSDNYDSSFDPAAMNKALSDAGYKDDKAVAYSAMNLSFDEDLTFMMAFKVPNGESATYLADPALANLIKSKHKPNADNCSLESGGPNYIVTMTKNINVKNLDSAVFGEDEFGQDVTPVLYLYRVYKASSNPDMKNLAISLYDFHVRAKEYQN